MTDRNQPKKPTSPILTRRQKAALYPTLAGSSSIQQRLTQPKEPAHKKLFFSLGEDIFSPGGGGDSDDHGSHGEAHDSDKENRDPNSKLLDRHKEKNGWKHGLLSSELKRACRIGPATLESFASCSPSSEPSQANTTTVSDISDSPNEYEEDSFVVNDDYESETTDEGDSAKSYAESGDGDCDCEEDSFFDGNEGDEEDAGGEDLEASNLGQKANESSNNGSELEGEDGANPVLSMKLGEPLIVLPMTDSEEEDEEEGSSNFGGSSRVKQTPSMSITPTNPGRNNQKLQALVASLKRGNNGKGTPARSSASAKKISKKEMDYLFLESLDSNDVGHNRYADGDYFAKNKRTLSWRLFRIFQRYVFDAQVVDGSGLLFMQTFNNRPFGGWRINRAFTIPSELEIWWSPTLTRSAGRFNPTVEPPRVELSEKLLNSGARLRQTLLHECCHAAVKLVDGVHNASHGKEWKKWVQKAHTAFPFLPPIEVCHQYDEAKRQGRTRRCKKTDGQTTDCSAAAVGDEE